MPVFAGCPRPILRLLETAEHVHGETGLNGVDLPEPSISAERRHAVDFLIETCRSAGPDGLTFMYDWPDDKYRNGFSDGAGYRRKYRGDRGYGGRCTWTR